LAEFPHGRDEWLNYAELDERTRELIRRRSTQGRAFFAVVLIGIGVLLFLSNLGLLPVVNLWRFWPLIPVAVGIGKLVNDYDTPGRTSGLVLIGFGALFLLFNLDVIHIRSRDGSWPFSLLMIGVGVVALLNVLDPTRGRNGRVRRAFATRQTGPPSQPPAADRPPQPPPIHHDGTGDTVILGSLKRRVESLAYQGGSTLVMFGSLELDLRRAQLPPGTRSLLINVQTLFGATKIRVPESWRVHLNAVSILGSFEDKTIPPNTGADAPTLVIAGYAIFSSVEIED
jgi:hypothetical protein